MRARDRLLVGAGWLLAVAASILVLVLASCGGSAGTPGADPSAAIERAEKALPLAELWDSRSGDVVAKPLARETLGEDAYRTFVSADPARARHLDMAAGMGYVDVIAAARVTYDNGAVMTTAALAGTSPADTAMLVVGSLPASEAMPEPPEAVFIARPILEDGKLVRVEFSSEKGKLSLDPATGAVDLVDAEHGSCAPWNCLAGAVYFWWEDNSDAMDGYWGTAGELCMDCLVLPLSQPVTCPLCAAFLGAPLVASVANCSIWPCDLCVSDSCFATEYGDARCVTENGVSVVRSTTTSGQCENPKTQQSECVVDPPETTIVEQCAWGCAPLGRTCRAPTECLPALQNCLPEQLAAWCNGATATVIEQQRRCEAALDPVSGEAVGGLCMAVPGDTEWRTFTCPYDCVDGGCLPPPTCDVTTCAGREEPVGEPTCIVRPDDGVSIVQQEYQQYDCTRVLSRVAGWPWPEGSTCAPTTIGARVIETCPGECTTDGTACAPTCDPAMCPAETAGATSCAYDYRRYKRYQLVEERACRPLATGGSACQSTGSSSREVGLCPWGCNAAGTDCAADTGGPEAPGEFLVLEGSAPGKTEFTWTDNSLDEQGFRIYYGGCSATPARPCQLIATIDADRVQALVDWRRTGADRCWEVRAFNARGESAPTWYCLPD